MNGYVKLFDSIFMSTVWQEDNPTRIVWITLLGKKDRDGIVEGSIPGLAHLARVTVEEAEAAINKFLAPDPHSRTSDYEGRRIEAIDGGWRVLNHEKYRDLLSREDKLERDRVRQQRHRERTCHTESVTKCDTRDMSQMSHHPDAVAVAVADAGKNKSTPSVPGTASDFNSTEAAQYVCQELALAGTEMRWLVRDVIDGELKKSAGCTTAIAEAMVAAWRKYSTLRRGMKYTKGVKAFFGEAGFWKDEGRWMDSADGRPINAVPARSAIDRHREHLAQEVAQ
jgi:hypothetical protein